MWHGDLEIIEKGEVIDYQEFHGESQSSVELLIDTWLLANNRAKRPISRVVYQD